MGGMEMCYVGVPGYRSRPLAGVLSVCETPEQFRGLEEVTSAKHSQSGV